jgi:hypothetical protein
MTRHLEDYTVAELAAAIVKRVGIYRDACTDQRDATQRAAARDFSLAITAAEDCAMRFTRGLAQRIDCFAPADLEVGARELVDRVTTRGVDVAEPPPPG